MSSFRTEHPSAVIIGDPREDASGLFHQHALRERGVSVRWLPMTAAMRDMRLGAQSLLQVARTNTYAVGIDPYAIRICEQSVLRSADMVIVVSDRFTPYEYAIGVALDQVGAVLTNAPEAVRSVADKYETDLRLHQAGLAVPRSELVITEDEAFAAAERLLYPVVVKQPNGTRGSGVEMAHDPLELPDALARCGLGELPVIVQQYVECDAKDKRMLFIDGEFKAAILRTAKVGDFRSNVAMGGSASGCSVSSREIRFGERVVRALGVRFVGLDVAVVSKVLPGREHLPVGRPFCIEANAKPAVTRFPSLYGVDVSPVLVDSMIGELLAAEEPVA